MPTRVKPAAASAHASPSASGRRRFESLFLDHLDSAYSLALRLTRQAEAAEDVVQDAYLRAMTAFDAYRGGDPRAWILALVRNRAFDWLREQKRKAHLPLGMHFADDPDQEVDHDPVDPDQPSPEQSLIDKATGLDMQALIDALPPRLREVLVLRDIEELSYRQIAEVVAAPIGTVMSRLSRARAQLGVGWRRLQAAQEGRA